MPGRIKHPSKMSFLHRQASKRDLTICENFLSTFTNSELRSAVQIMGITIHPFQWCFKFTSKKQPSCNFFLANSCGNYWAPKSCGITQILEKSKGRLIAFYAIFYPITIANIVILVINIISFFARRDILTGSPVWHSSWINFIIELFALWILLSSGTQVYCIPNDKRLPVVFRFPGSNYASGSLRAWLMRQGYILIVCSAFIVQTYSDSGGMGYCFPF